MIAESSVDQVGEIIELLLSQSDESYEFHHLFLAARCYQEIRNPSSLMLRRQTLSCEIEKLTRFDFPFYYQDWREPDLQQRRSRVRIRALTAASLLLPDARQWFRRRAAEDDDWDVRQAAVQELARGWKADPDTLALLKDRAANDDDNDVRQAAVQELVREWKDDPDTLPWLKDRAANDAKDWVRKAAAQELARGWKADPEVQAFLAALPREG